MQRLLVVVVAATALFTASSAAQQQPRNVARERKIEEALASVAPGVVPAFRRATEAMDSGRHAEAEPLFREVLAAAPTFTPAIRRLGGLLIERGVEREGLDRLKQAVQLDRSPENLISLATGLAFRPGGKMGSIEEMHSALELAKEAAASNPDREDESYVALVAQLAFGLNDNNSFRGAVTVLKSNHPGTMATHYFSAIAAVLDEQWEQAESEIREAERLGLPKDTVEHFLASGVHTRANGWRYARYVGYLFGVWAAGLLLLFVAGRLLSRRMLSSIERADPNVLANDAERSLRRVYRTVITCAGAYYYVSLPFVLVLVVGGVAAVVYGFVTLGRVPIKLVAILVIGALVTVFKMLQSLFIKVAAQDPGRALEEHEAPALWKLAREVADSVSTRAVDEIRITPGTDMAVYERGSAGQRRQDVARRVLILGVGLINGFQQGAFRAVLAHEYGHFSHRDTAGGDVALRVRRDMTIFAMALYEQGQAVWWNLAFQFVRLYDFLFRRISHGATRLQEVLADRMAAHVYGPAAFEDGLRHVITRSVEFEAAVNVELQTAANTRRRVHDLYALPPLPKLASMDVERQIAGALSRATTEDDTHPGPSDRFRLVKGVSYKGGRPDSTPVWDLFPARHQLTAEMTAVVARQFQGASFAGV